MGEQRLRHLKSYDDNNRRNGISEKIKLVTAHEIRNNRFNFNTEQMENWAMNKKKLVAFDYLRVIALGMIVYDHLGGFYNPNWWIKRLVDFFFAIPLNIIQDFGAFGVSLFFLISGFLFSYNGNYNNEYRRATRKMIKIYVGCIISFLSFLIVQKIVWLLKPTYWSQFSMKQWIESITLIGYFTGNGDVINGTTWFLIPLFWFYIVRIGYAWLHEKLRVEMNILCVEIFLAVLMVGLKIFQCKSASWLVFVYMPIAGMILGEVFRENSKLSMKRGIALFLMNYSIMIICFWKFAKNYCDTSLYFVSFMYSVALVILFIMLKDKFEENKIVVFLCKISLSVYLTHMTFGSFLLTVCSAIKIPFTVSFLITMGVIVVLSYIHMKVMNVIVK